MSKQDFENLTGMKVKRDEFGRFEQVSLSSDRAREISSRRGARDVAALLRDRGVADPENADAGLVALADIALSGRSGAVSAMRYLDVLTGHGRPQEESLRIDDFSPGISVTIGGVLYSALSAERWEQIIDKYLVGKYSPKQAGDDEKAEADTE